jgi:hypothetical protein
VSVNGLSCLSEHPGIFVGEMPEARPLNRTLLRQFLDARDTAGVRRSHFFEGRYENLYIGLDRVPAAAAVLDRVGAWAARILGRDSSRLRRGFWFNLMEPGQRTLAHTHHDAGELLSAVYYIRVPPDSGALRLRPASGDVLVRPREGMVVMFPPDLEHEVSENLSRERRLSIGINIGT